MTFVIKHTRSEQPIVAEYLCPVHGRFSLTVDRDANGDAPGEMLCPAPNESVWTPVPVRGCSFWSPYVISAPRVGVRRVEVVRGGYQKPERPTWTDTTNLGEGQDLDDWHDERDKVWERDREDSIKEMGES